MNEPPTDLAPGHRFQGLNPRALIDVTRGKLPHWHQLGRTYFVTFRTADSLPQSLAKQWHTERTAWLAARGIEWDPDEEWKSDFANLSVKDQTTYHQHFSDQLDELLDQGLGRCALRDSTNGPLVADALAYFNGQRYWLGLHVVMPNHVHALVAPVGGTSLKSITYSWKHYTARELNQRNGCSGRFWQSESYDRIVRDAGELRGFERYIEENPKKAGLRWGCVLRGAPFPI